MPVLTGIDRDGRCIDALLERRSKDWLKEAVGHPPRRKGALGLGRVNAHHETKKTQVNAARSVMLRLERRVSMSPRETLRAALTS